MSIRMIGKVTARVWVGPLQIQVWREGWFWLIAWNGNRRYVAINGSGLRDIETGWFRS